MNVILRFLRNNLHFIVFLMMQVFCVYQVVTYNSYQRASAFNTSNAISGYVYRTRTSITEYFNLAEKNRQLALENAYLRSELMQSFILADTHRRVASDTLKKPRYSYTVAEVINSSVNRTNTFVTLNKGKREGVTPGMAVIGPMGIVGIVYDVSENFSVAISVLNSNFKVSPFIPEIGFKEGSITWNGSDPGLVQLNGVNKFEPLKKGMKVFTSAYSTNFPAGIAIGQVETFTVPKNGSFYEVNIRLSTDFNKLGAVYVVHDVYRNETDTLQKKIQIPQQ